MEEKKFFEKGGVSVSSARFIVDGQTYAMSAVTSVKQAVKEPSRGLAILLGVIGLLICLAGTPIAIVIGLLTITIAISWAVSLRAEYIVVLSTSSGESQALKSNDKGYVESIVSALNESIIHRG